MKNIKAKQLINILYQEGFHILICSDTQVKKFSGFAPIYCQDDNTIKGLILPDRNEIVINKAFDLHERVLTLIHELIHLFDPKISEDQTENEAIELYNNLNDSDLGYFEFAVSHTS